ncbi:hypothetical protein SPRG_20409 [Saprolegnia parasitica CBS 223.65]|uniref:Uncharacterized protein n=1 Tax=Saprolegnia parasitica (strain CBS 223.65) TaxID=695850 RepID=A0A067C944_SAPPC|nr:hypothetical protein SPRG_20409 [Saprolegnia parasitica CBS 223.65]KDO27274.1 hypothetical protein SPRG_20409 [Saprolegnia parasitica CBS 223.65]|eukprot:XP_012202114.1 hypothetical protein SPRG_20409 [Saprolegnia parasitica CBS 223.65]
MDGRHRKGGCEEADRIFSTRIGIARQDDDDDEEPTFFFPWTWRVFRSWARLRCAATSHELRTMYELVDGDSRQHNGAPASRPPHAVFAIPTSRRFGAGVHILCTLASARVATHVESKVHHQNQSSVTYD